MEPIIVDSSFSNLSLGFGNIGKDPSVTWFVREFNITSKELTLLFEINNLAANIVEYLPQSMGQKQAVFDCDNENVTKMINDKIKYVTNHFIEASKVARLTGGSAIFLGNSDFDLSAPFSNQPIDFYNVIEGGNHGNLKIIEVDKNPFSRTYNKPSLYKLTSNSTLIHGSRLLPFYGNQPLVNERKNRWQRWGIPVLYRSYEHLKNLEVANQSLTTTLTQFCRLVYEIDDLMALLSSEQGKALLKSRLELMNYSWTILKTMIVKTGEKVYNIKVDYAHLIEILNHLKSMLASSCDIPSHILFNSGGESSGMATSSKADSGSVNRSSERQWADYVNRRQVDDWQPYLEYLIGHWLIGYNVKNWRITFPSIIQLSEMEQEILNKTRLENEQLAQKSVSLIE